MVKYEWDESNGVSVPTNKLMVIDADEYYVGMPLKKVDAETVAPTDGDPEYICLAQRNAGDEIRPLQIPVQEVFPDAVYTKILEDGTEEKVKFGGGGGGASDWNASEGEVGHIKNRTHYERTIVHDFVTEIIVPFGTSLADGYGTLPNLKIPIRNVVMPEGKYILIRLGGEELKLTALPPNVGGSRPAYREDITLNNGVTIRIMLTTDVPGTHLGDRDNYYYNVMPLPDGAEVPYIGQTFSVSLCEDEIKKLDPKFLPPGIGGGGGAFVVKFISDESMNLTCELSYDEILAEYEKGIIAGAIIVDDKIMAQYPNVSIDEDGDIYFCTVFCSGEMVIIGYVWINRENEVNFFNKEITTS